MKYPNTSILKNLFLFIYTTILFSLQSFGQTSGITYIQGEKFPYPTIQNLTKWTNYSLSEWKNEMINYNFSKNGIGEKGDNYYSKSFDFSDGTMGATYSVSLFPSKKIQITYSYYNDKALFDDFINQIEPYYIESHKGGLVEYGITKGDSYYRIIIMRTPSMEVINIDKFSHTSKSIQEQEKKYGSGVLLWGVFDIIKREVYGELSKKANVIKLVKSGDDYIIYTKNDDGKFKNHFKKTKGFDEKGKYVDEYGNIYYIKDLLDSSVMALDIIGTTPLPKFNGDKYIILRVLLLN